MRHWPAGCFFLDGSLSGISTKAQAFAVVHRQEESNRADIHLHRHGLLMCTMSLAAWAPPQPQTHTVTIEGLRFQPDVLTVAPGDTIVWVNKDLVPHTATSKTGGFDSKGIEADESWSYTIRKTGDCAYICTFHPTMKAMLRVKE